MKKSIIRIIFLLSLSINAQVKIDNIYSIDFPNNYEKSESIEKAELPERFKGKVSNRVKVKTYTFNNSDKDFYILITTKYINENNEPIEYNPESISELYNKYGKYSKKIIESFSRKGFKFKDSTSIRINNFFGQKISFKDSISGNTNAEGNLIEINGKQYFAIYSKIAEFNENRKNKFLNSIKIDSSKEVKQITKPYDLKENLLELFFKGIFVIGIFYLIRKYKKTTGNTV